MASKKRRTTGKKRKTTRKKLATKGVSKKKRVSKLLPLPPLPVSEAASPQATRWPRRWPRKDEVPGYDRTAFDIPGAFETLAHDFHIWPFYAEADAKPFRCLVGKVENAPIYYDGGRKVAGRHNWYYLAE